MSWETRLFGIFQVPKRPRSHRANLDAGRRRFTVHAGRESLFKTCIDAMDAERALFDDTARTAFHFGLTPRRHIWIVVLASRLPS